jgi:hypothetical protein
MFAALLFTAYFCFACCFLYTPSSTEQISKESEKLKKEKELPQVPPTLLQDKPQAAAIEENLEVEPQPRPVPMHQEDTSVLEEPWTSQPLEKAQEQKVDEPASNPLTIEELIEDVDLDNLQLRPARKIAGKLGIQQKVNGKDQSLGFLRGQIKKQLEEQPQEVAPVIQEILSAS